MQKSMAGQDWAMLFGLALVFGSAFFLVKLALGSYGPLTVALIRVALGCLILASGCRLARAGAAAGPEDLALPPRHGRAQQCHSLRPHLLGPDPYRERADGDPECDDTDLHRARGPCGGAGAAEPCGAWRESALGFLGVAVLIGPASLRHLDLTNLAEIAVLLAAVSYAAAGIWGRRLRELPIEVAAAGMLGGSTLLLLPLALLLEHPWRISPTPASLAALAALGALSTAVAYLLYFRLLRRVGPTNLLLVTFLLPIVALAPGRGLPGGAHRDRRCRRARADPPGARGHRRPHLRPRQGHITCGGRDIRIASGFPPVLRPKTVPRS